MIYTLFTLSVSGRILNGQAAKDGAWPWQVSVQMYGSHNCGGSLISESWVVSAAHCFDPPVVNSAYRVQLGEKRIFDQTRNQTFSSVKRVILNPSFDSASHQSDIALVELENPILLTAAISPVCLLDASVRVPAETPCWVTGWGNRLPQSDHSLSLFRPYLMEVEVRTVDAAVCNRRFREALKQPAGSNPIKEDMLCAGSMEGYKGFTSLCGDGGGPLVCERNGTWYLAGIVSWLMSTTVNGVTSVASGYPGVYNRPNAHNEWIQKNVPNVTFTVVDFPSNSAHSSAMIPSVLLLTILLWLTV
uniref:Peptidase S1 domain-containing protein n=1 Tax=Chelydra serpentina TaxID=8475 RepID=A0A8C3TBI4_CHESE